MLIKIGKGYVIASEIAAIFPEDVEKSKQYPLVILFRSGKGVNIDFANSEDRDSVLEEIIHEIEEA